MGRPCPPVGALVPRAAMDRGGGYADVAGRGLGRGPPPRCPDLCGGRPLRLCGHGRGPPPREQVAPSDTRPPSAALRARNRLWTRVRLTPAPRPDRAGGLYCFSPPPRKLRCVCTNILAASPRGAGGRFPTVPPPTSDPQTPRNLPAGPEPPPNSFRPYPCPGSAVSCTAVLQALPEPVAGGPGPGCRCRPRAGGPRGDPLRHRPGAGVPYAPRPFPHRVQFPLRQAAPGPQRRSGPASSGRSPRAPLPFLDAGRGTARPQPARVWRPCEDCSQPPSTAAPVAAPAPCGRGAGRALNTAPEPARHNHSFHISHNSHRKA